MLSFTSFGSNLVEYVMSNGTKAFATQKSALGMVIACCALRNLNVFRPTSRCRMMDFSNTTRLGNPNSNPTLKYQQRYKSLDSAPMLYFV